MRKITRKGIFISLVFLITCSAWVLAHATEPPALARLSGAEKERVAKLIEGAKREGEVLYYSVTLRPDVQARFIPAFRKEYGLSESDLKITILSLRTANCVQKVTQELRANIYMTDVVQNGTFGWFKDLIARGEIMAYDSPEYKHFHPMARDPEIAPAYPPYFIATQYTTWSPVYNPKYVKGEIKHWKDILRPEYNGKISMTKCSDSFSAIQAYVAIKHIMGLDYWKEIAKRKPFMTASSSTTINKCVSGEFPINLTGANSLAFRANLKGAGLKIVHPPEGYAAVAYPVVILAHAPHPNAAKLIVDFHHSETWQTTAFELGYVLGRLGIKSKYPDFPKPIYDLKGFVKMDWRKLGSEDFNNAREEFRKLMEKR